jgi:hypothetical protein
MIRQEPPSDWIAYAIVLGITLATIIGKILIAKGDKKDDKSKDN